LFAGTENKVKFEAGASLIVYMCMRISISTRISEIRTPRYIYNPIIKRKKREEKKKKETHKLERKSSLMLSR
jgi:hypothetical protein